MKKIHSLIKACMTSDMNLFVINSKRKKLPLLIAMLFMFVIWLNADILFEKMAPLHLEYLVLSLFVFLTAITIIMEGIYKSGPLIFDCKDDGLLLSLPIKRSTVLFIRIFKFYVFELAFTAIFIVPLAISYIKWTENLDWTFFLTTITMLLTFPIIPVAISCVLGAINTSIASRFKYKNIVQIITAISTLLLIMYFSYHADSFLDYVIKNATSINDLITKIYYPAGLYARLVQNFNAQDLIIYVLINIIIFTITILILSKVYFKINSRLKKVTTTSKNIKKLKIKAKSINKSLIKKELTTFFQTPVFIINAGFALILFLAVSIMIAFRYDSIVPMLTNPNGFNLPKDLITNNTPLLVFIMITVTAFMTSITNSVISLEGKNINTVKTLPITTKTVLMSKIYSSLLITTPALLVGDLILLMKFETSIYEALLLIALSILMPLVSHFIGLLINLKYPKLDAQNSAEVVKQSTSSFVSVMIGMILLVITVAITINIAGKISTPLILLVAALIFLLIDTLLYLILIKQGIKKFNSLSV